MPLGRQGRSWDKELWLVGRGQTLEGLHIQRPGESIFCLSSFQWEAIEIFEGGGGASCGR